MTIETIRLHFFEGKTIRLYISQKSLFNHMTTLNNQSINRNYYQEIMAYHYKKCLSI